MFPSYVFHPYPFIVDFYRYRLIQSSKLAVVCFSTERIYNGILKQCSRFALAEFNGLRVPLWVMVLYCRKAKNKSLCVCFSRGYALDLEYKIKCLFRFNLRLQFSFLFFFVLFILLAKQKGSSFRRFTPYSELTDPAH